MGIETSAELGGAESSFTSACVVIEELAKVDPSVSVLCDVHNTLVNTIFRKYGNQQQQEKYLPQLSSEKVPPFKSLNPNSELIPASWAPSVSAKLLQVQTHSLSKLVRPKSVTTTC
jgi:hypothetical protein